MFATPFKTPNKLVNAGSFGIPTVAYPEMNFVKEWDQCFVQADTMQKMIASLELLKNNKDYYLQMSQKALIKAEKNYIYHIGKLYKNLYQN